MMLIKAGKKSIMATVLQAFLSMETKRNYKLVIKDTANDFVHNVLDFKLKISDFKLKISLYCHVCKFWLTKKNVSYMIGIDILRCISTSMFTNVFFLNVCLQYTLL
jgi:hypothetical protein